ncbi:hypothetical protein JCM10908_003339 [Rhodotorula pacifica]|uniref:uncharacterized protein n=1 Tax=Rhodotorula pacifica TaxID=1495444 RepID=UPI00317D3C56
MSLRTLLNDPLPPIRLDHDPEQRAGDGSRELQGGEQQHRLGRTSSAPDNAYSAWPPAESRLVGKNDPSLAASLAMSLNPLSVSQVLHTTSLLKVERVVERMRTAIAAVRDSKQLCAESGTAISKAFNSAEPPAARAALWRSWVRYSNLANRLAMPVYPVQPDQVALAVSVYTPLPIRNVLREFAGIRDTIPLDGVREMMSALNLAARATRHLWPDIVCFIRAPEQYESTRAVLNFIETYSPTQAMLIARPPPPSDFYSAGVARQARRPIDLSRDSFSARPLLTQVPPAPPPPQHMTPPPDQFIQPTRKQPRKLREICDDLPSILRTLADQPHDPADFDSAQERFSAVNTPQYAHRAENLFKTAVEYTKVSALLEFPTYPITTLKLAVFALTMTPGPLGKLLDKVARLVPDQRESPRLSGPDFEATLKDLTTVYKITRAEEEDVPKAETTEWLQWWEELTADWKGALKRRDESRPSQTARKRTKLSPSPAVSDASVASTSKASTSKATKVARSRISVTEQPPSRSASPAATSRSCSVKPSAGRTSKKGAAAKAVQVANISKPIVYPVFVPDKKGKLPDKRREPPFPPIMDSPWYVPKKKKEKPKAADVDEDSAPSEYESSEDEEAAKKRVGRSVALHRPRRGANDMVAWDVSTFWE